MKNYTLPVALFFIILLSSCSNQFSVKKRLYTKGYSVDIKKGNKETKAIAAKTNSVNSINTVNNTTVISTSQSSAETDIQKPANLNPVNNIAKTTSKQPVTTAKTQTIGNKKLLNKLHIVVTSKAAKLKIGKSATTSSSSALSKTIGILLIVLGLIFVIVGLFSLLLLILGLLLIILGIILLVKKRSDGASPGRPSNDGNQKFKNE